MSCPSCAQVRINGILCHEQGCPDAWKDYVRWCKFCGGEFHPSERNQACCDEECQQAYEN